MSVPHFAPETILFDKDRRTNMTEENRNALMQRNDRLIRDVIQKAAHMERRGTPHHYERSI